MTIHNIEHRKKGVRRDTVEALAKALLFDDTDDREARSLVAEALAAAGFMPPTQEITRAITDEEWQLIESYRGNRPEQRELYQRLMANSVEVRGKEPNPEDVPLTE